VSTVEQLLERLPEQLRANFTLVYDSRSPHRRDIDRRFPRIVLFSTDGRLLLALTGNPSAASYDRVEAIYFDDRESRFHTSRFVLSDAVRRTPALAGEAARNGALDGRECTRCHGADVRPIFDSYALWPGFYGSRADRMDLNAAEARDFAAFGSDGLGRGLYRQLQFPSGSPFSPYDDGSIRPPGDSLRFHPNERLGIALTTLNWRRIVRKLASEGHDYRALRYRLLSGLMGCSALPIPDGFERSIIAALEADNRSRLARGGLPPDSDEARRLRMQELVPVVAHGVAEVAYVAQAVAVSRADWSMSLEPLALGFFDGVLTRPVRYVAEDLATAMLGEVAATDRAFAEYYAPRFVFAPYGYDIGLKLEFGELYGNVALCGLLDRRAREVHAPLLRRADRLGEGPVGRTTTS
jgi:hypothetical protein